MVKLSISSESSSCRGFKEEINKLRGSSITAPHLILLSKCKAEIQYDIYIV